MLQYTELINVVVPVVADQVLNTPSNMSQDLHGRIQICTTISQQKRIHF